MNHQDLMEKLSMELKRISGLSIQQSEKCLLIASALEGYRKGRNRQMQQQQKKFMDSMAKFRIEKKIREQENNKKFLEQTAGTELFDSFVKKFIKEKKDE